MTHRNPRIPQEWPLYMAVFLDLLGFGMVLADVQLRAQELTPRGWYPGAVVGGLLASTFIVQSLISPFWGRLSDRAGRKPVLIACTLLSAVAMAIYGSGGGLASIFASRLVAGFGGANVAVGQAFLADRLEGSARTVALGRLGAAISVGLILGPALGGWLIHSIGYRQMALSAAVASGFGVLLLAAALPAGKPKETGPRARGSSVHLQLLRDLPAVRPYALIAVVAWLSLAMLEGTFARLINRLFGYDQLQFGFLFGYEALVGFVIQAWLLSLILRQASEGPLLRFAYLSQGVGLALNPASWLLRSVCPPMVTLVLASTLFAVGGGVANPTINGICSRLTPEERQGELFGLLQGARSIGFVVGPVLGGLLFDRWPPGPYLLAGGVCVLAALLVPATAPTS